MNFTPLHKIVKEVREFIFRYFTLRKINSRSENRRTELSKIFLEAFGGPILQLKPEKRHFEPF